ncbi:MAG: DUF1523 family protein [Paracoccaceae bacterium]
MLTYLKWGFRIFLILLLGLFLHYTLPQHDIVRIINTETRITTVGANWLFYASPDTGTAEGAETRDIRFIDAVFPDGDVIVYRNEDTGWVWPPYFKYDSANLQAEANNFKSTQEAPKWVSVTHYGWRFPFMSIYPNAVGMRLVEGPDTRIIPWVNIIVLTTLLFLALMLRRMWMQFRERTIDPALADVGEAWDSVDAKADAARAKASGFFGRIGAWINTWRSPPRR